MANSIDTDRIIPSKVQARNRLLNIDQVCEVAVEEEEKTYPIESLEEERGYFIEVNTNTLLTLKNASSIVIVNTAEAYTNVTHGLSSEWKSFTGNMLLVCATLYESKDWIRHVSVEIKVPKKVSYTVDDRVEGIESEEVKRFCEEHGLMQYLISAIDIVRKCFPTIQELFLEKEEDPESGEEWIVIDITVGGEIEEVLENYNNYITMFVSGIPWPAREKIILSYNIL